MGELKEYFTDNKNIALYQIRYDLNSDSQGEINLDIHDEVHALDKSEMSITVLFKRKLVVNPKKTILLSISFIIEHMLKDEYIGKVSWGEYDIDGAINEEKDYFASQCIPRTSLLISEITSAFTTEPVITPPIFIKKLD